MKPATRVMDVTSTLQGEKIGMKIDPLALDRIMSVLTDLYSDPEMAVIREYSTNAFDAHVEGFVDRPIEVTLPTNLSPFFRVRDYGEGLDADDIRDIYSQYGASTKRDSNDVVGMLGLGCKSALTYSDQFTLTGIKNGICTEVSISRDEDGSGSMTIVDVYPTTEHSGVEVIVPVKRENSFEEKSKDFFRFWTEGTVLVNGKQPKRISGFKIADDLYLSDEVGESYFVMGNVAYPWPDSESEYGQWPTVAFVEIGAVNFTPSRESLQMTNQTKETLKFVKERVKNEREGAFIRQLDEKPTKFDALVHVGKASSLGIKGDLTYKGQEIPSTVSCEKQRFLLVDAVKRYRVKGWSYYRDVATSLFPRTIWLTGFTAEGLSTTRRQKLTQWMEKQEIKFVQTNRYYYGTPQGDGVTQFVLVDELPAMVTEWGAPNSVFPWAEIEAEKIVREKRVNASTGRISGSYRGYVGHNYQSQIIANDIDSSKPVLWYGKYFLTSKIKELIEKTYPNGYTLVELGANRVAKFKRDFPASKYLGEHVRELVKAWEDSLSEEDRVFIYTRQLPEITKLQLLDATKINDPKLRAAVHAATTKNSKLIKESEFYNAWVSITAEWKNPLEDYPLLTNLYTYGKMSEQLSKHTHIYLNAVYAAHQEESA